MPDWSWLSSLLQFLAYLFVFALGVGVLALLVIYFIDVNQTKHAIRRNYPVIGRFRYWFEEMGVFFRQYFFAMDREEMPFNRAERGWVYRAAKNLDNMQAFGSTRDLRPEGTVLFVNCAWPTLAEDAVPARPLVIGGDQCRQPYAAPSFFNISGMSYGALSIPAVLALGQGARAAGAWMNTGEGGVSPWHLQTGADLVFQIGTAKYGVRDAQGRLSDEKLRQVAAHDQIKMFEIKLSQGAKPGKGGILPGAKVTEEIARIRGIPVGKDSISPNRHPDINSEDDLLEMIERIRRVTGKPVGIKLVVGNPAWLERLCQAITERGPASAPDFITVDGADGGTGASPSALIDYMGLPLRESLPKVVDTIAAHGLGERIRIIASGKLITPAEVAWALCVGADFVVTARGFMFALGCIQAMQCNKDTCPTGITTHDPKLQKGLVVEEKAVRVRNYIDNIRHEVGVIAHACGVRDPRRLGRGHARIVTGPGVSISLADYYRRDVPSNS